MVEPVELNRGRGGVSMHGMTDAFDLELTRRLLRKLSADAFRRLLLRLALAALKAGLIAGVFLQLVVWLGRLGRCLSEHVTRIDLFAHARYEIPKLDFASHPEMFAVSGWAILGALAVASVVATVAYLAQRSGLLGHRLQSQLLLAQIEILDRLDRLERRLGGAGPKG
jgi:hypothetical protein